ncbi:hypothetical protein AKJ16_DCAP23084 [Drosera capensis]
MLLHMSHNLIYQLFGNICILVTLRRSSIFWELLQEQHNDTKPASRMAYSEFWGSSEVPISRASLVHFSQQKV